MTYVSIRLSYFQFLLRSANGSSNVISPTKHDVGQTQAQLSRKLLFSVVRLFLSFYNEGWGLYSKPSKGPCYPVQRGRFLSRPLEAINPRVEASSKSEN